MERYTYSDLLNFCKFLEIQPKRGKKKVLLINALTRYFEDNFEFFEIEFQKWKSNQTCHSGLLFLKFEEKKTNNDNFLKDYQQGYTLNGRQIHCFYYKPIPQYDNLVYVYLVYVHILNSRSSVKDLPHEQPSLVHFSALPNWEIILNYSSPQIKNRNEIQPLINSNVKKINFTYDCLNQKFLNVYLSS